MKRWVKALGAYGGLVAALLVLFVAYFAVILAVLSGRVA